MNQTSEGNRIRSDSGGRHRFPSCNLRLYAALVFGFVGYLVAVPRLASGFPRPQGYVNDFARILNRQSEDLDSELRAFELRTGAEIVVVTVRSLDGMTIDSYANGLFNEWRIGKRGKDNGILILVAPSERRVRIEVGYGLEPILPDGLAGEIIRSKFLPAFRRGDLQIVF